MSILTAVESARKATAPIVGIPVEGERPFACRRSLLVESLKGLTLIDAAIQPALDGSRADSLLMLYATGPRVQAIRRIIPFSNVYQLKMELWQWAERERAKRAKPKVKMSSRDKGIARLDKQLGKLGKPHTPQHPLLYKREHMHGYREAGEQWAEFKREANVRRWIQQQAQLCKAGKFNTAKLYQLLAERGLKVTKYSDVGVHRGVKTSPYSREALHDVFAYLAHLWEFCGLTGKPSYWFEPDDTEYSGPAHYASWLAHLHEYKELQSMIEGLKDSAGLAGCASQPTA